MDCCFRKMFIVEYAKLFGNNFVWIYNFELAFVWSRICHDIISRRVLKWSLLLNDYNFVWIYNFELAFIWVRTSHLLVLLAPKMS